jgi:hypothetical protein
MQFGVARRILRVISPAGRLGHFRELPHYPLESTGLIKIPSLRGAREFH